MLYLVFKTQVRTAMIDLVSVMEIDVAMSIAIDACEEP